jgi:Holliday junction resolvase
MPNKNYLSGRRKEYKVMKEFKAHEMIALRSAGSHSPIDVVGINWKSKIIYLVQCKPKSMSKKKTQELQFEMEQLNGMYQVYSYVQQ